jgi:hypothetical protein
LRATASPKASAESFMNQQKMDARPFLSGIRVPTLVMARRNYRWVSVRQSRYLAEHIPGARLVELPGSDSHPFWETPDLILDHIEEFLTGVRQSGAPERMLVAVLFTDIVARPTAPPGGDAAACSIGSSTASCGSRWPVRQVANQSGDGSLSIFDPFTRSNARSLCKAPARHLHRYPRRYSLR